MKTDDISSCCSGSDAVSNTLYSTSNYGSSNYRAPGDDDDMSGFEIRVALIGYVSVGKTMILNALLKDKYSEVSMKRATAGINHFRINSTTSDGKSSDKKASHQQLQELCSSAQATLEETTLDNQTLRNSDHVEQKTFDIELDEPLFEMRRDTKLVLIDVPGINEAGVSKKYRDYVSNHWHTFDCVVVVLDGRQGVNTEEQVDLLDLAKRKCKDVKDVPLIVVLNKMDDPDDEEQRVLVEETTQAIENMFQVSDRVKSLNEILAFKKTKNPHREKTSASARYSPIVVSMSAVYAYIYRAASRLSLEVFKSKIDINLIDKLGKEAYGGQRWKKLTLEQKYKNAYEVVQDSDQYEDGINASRFSHLLKALSFWVGGAERQTWLIEVQLRMLTNRLESHDDFVSELKTLYDKSTKLGTAASARHSINSRFSELFNQSNDAAFANFSDCPKMVHHLAKPMKELLAFCNLSKHMHDFDTSKALDILKCGKMVVLRQMDLVLSPNAWNDKQMTPSDWTLVCGAMLGQTRDRSFDDYFGIARILLESKFQQACYQIVVSETIKKCEKCKSDTSLHLQCSETLRCDRCRIIYHPHSGNKQAEHCPYCKSYYSSQMTLNYNHGRQNYGNDHGYCSNCGYFTANTTNAKEHMQHHFDGSHLVATYPEALENVLHVNLVDSPKNPMHFGHVIWQFSKLCLILLDGIGHDDKAC
ncbi:hypothetical protein ACA910_002225 [Epithemia clementina (nom. ined.)]